MPGIFVKHIAIIFIAGFFQVLPFKGLCQNATKWEKYGDLSYAEKDFYGASVYFQKALEEDSSNIDLMYKYAESLRQYNEYELAEKAYMDVYQADMGQTYKEALFFAATMKKHNMKYEEAKKDFKKYASLADKNSYLYRKSIQEIKSCDFAQSKINDTVAVEILNMGPSINTTGSEFSPQFIHDSAFVFSSIRAEKVKEGNIIEDKIYKVKIYKAYKENNEWRQAELDTAINNSSYHIANGTGYLIGKIFFTGCDKNYNCKIYKSELTNSSWTKGIPLNEKINAANSNSTMPYLTIIDGKEVLLFCSNRKGGKGGYDIYYSVADEQGNFSDPVNLGPNINTEDDDITPVYNSGNQILYFSSSWHEGFGGHDIFRSKGPLTSLSTPENIGYPLNTSCNDLYYVVSSDTTHGLITSNRKGSITSKGETCCNDLWYFKKEVIPVQLAEIPEEKIVDKTEEEKNLLITSLPVTLYFHNDEPDARRRDTLTKRNYLETCIDYISMKDLYISNFSKHLKPQEKTEAENDIALFFAEKVEKGAADLEQFTERLTKLLESGYRLELTIKGHASPLARTDYNVPLTKRRISSLVNYFKEYKNGILLPFLADSAENGGCLRIVSIPFGEYKAGNTVSDNYHDQRNSVYSRAAAEERFIQITSLHLMHKDSLHPEIHLPISHKDIGDVKAGKKMKLTFHYKNTGKSDLIISSFRKPNYVNIISHDEKVHPGKFGKAVLEIDYSSLSGKQVTSIHILSNAIHYDKEFAVTSEVTP
ncbi:MAG: DUF1573 domain-containing protein [Cytophagaceae bacterium]